MTSIQIKKLSLSIVLFLFVTVILYSQADSSIIKADTSLLVVVMEVPDTVITKSDTTGIVDYHPQDSPLKTGFLITTSDGSAQLRFRGSIRMNGILDLNGLQNRENFQTLDIPVGDENVNEARFYLSARQTRFWY